MSLVPEFFGVEVGALQEEKLRGFFDEVEDDFFFVKNSGAGEFIHFTEKDGGLFACFLNDFQHLWVYLIRKIILQQRVLLDLGDTHSFGWIEDENFSKEVF